MRDFLGVCEEQHRIGDRCGANLAARLRRLRSHLQETNHSRTARPPVEGALRLMTIHEAKGRTFEAVHLVGLSAWGRSHRAGSDGGRGERALFEVAVSRAARRLHVSCIPSGAGAPSFAADFERMHRPVRRAGPVPSGARAGLAR